MIFTTTSLPVYRVNPSDNTKPTEYEAVFKQGIPASEFATRISIFVLSIFIIYKLISYTLLIITAKIKALRAKEENVIISTICLMTLK